MAGLLAYVAAGMAKGAGDSMIEKAKAKREDAREELRYRRQVARDEAAREHQSNENTLSREHQSGENALNRGHQTSERLGQQEHQTGENALNRGHQTSERLGQQEHQTGENALNRGHQTSERLGQQEHQTSEREAEQFFRAEENRLDRTSQQILQGARLSAERRRQLELDEQYTEFFTDNEGNLVGARKVGPSEIVKDENGNPVKVQTKTRPNDPVMDAKRMDEIADKRARAVAGPEPDQQSLSYDPADLDAWNEKYMKALNTERQKLGLDPVGSAPTAAAVEMPKTIKGSGTSADPYTVTTQAEIDWLLANGTPGHMVIVDGTPYKIPDRK